MSESWCPNICSDITLDVPVRVILDEVNIKINGLVSCIQ